MKMKKLIIIIISSFLFMNNLFSEIINLKCPTRTGSLIPYVIDTEKKMVGRYPYKLNLSNEVEFNFWNQSKEDNGLFFGSFVKINLQDETYIMKVINKITKKQIRIMMKKDEKNQLFFDDIKEGIFQEELSPIKCQNLQKIDTNQDTVSKKSIKDFSLEFYKIGDSLLDVANESLILEAKKFSEFKNRQYYEVNFEIDSDLYDHVQFYLRSGDKNYTILAVAFIKEMSLNQCLVRKAQLNIEWNKKFSKQYFITDKKPIEWDKTGKSITDTDQYTFYDSSIARISCRDWSEKMKKDYDYGDDLRVSYESADITSWMKNGYR